MPLPKKDFKSRNYFCLGPKLFSVIIVSTCLASTTIPNLKLLLLSIHLNCRKLAKLKSVFTVTNDLQIEKIQYQKNQRKVILV